MLKIFGLLNGYRLQRKDTYFQYSTSEQFTGEYWVDGKKIYCKTLTGSYTKGQKKYIATGVTNIDKLWIVEDASYIHAEGVAFASINTDVKTTYVYCWYRANNASANKNTLELLSDNWGGNYAITIRYTKK